MGYDQPFWLSVEEAIVSENRDQWGSSLGFILAAAGSAIGLGNLWKFPYIAWDNNGGAFVIVYLVCIALIGFPIMLAEILLGRHFQASPVPAFEKAGADAKGGSKAWSIVGWLGVICGVVILSFYAVIAGWSLSSFVNCMNWSISGYETPNFGAFVENTPLQLVLSFVFLGITSLIVMRGISGGIEKSTKILMPVLFSILVLLVLNSVRLEGFGQAMSFIFAPDFSKLSSHSILEALGHSFFTLSLGMGAMITYGSYMSRKESIKKAAFAISLLDTVIALMACIIMYSIIFSVPELQKQLAESSGAGTAGMLFVTLPEMFYTKMSGGQFIAPIFFILVGFAALSSTISLLEVVVSLLVDKMNMSRVKSTVICASGIYFFSALCALSLNSGSMFSKWKPFFSIDALNHRFFADKAGVLNVFDHFSANWLLPIGGLLTTLFVGWFFDPKRAARELEMVDGQDNPTPAFRLYQFVMRFVAPAAILYIIFEVIKGTDFS